MTSFRYISQIARSRGSSNFSLWEASALISSLALRVHLPSCVRGLLFPSHDRQCLLEFSPFLPSFLFFLWKIELLFVTNLVTFFFLKHIFFIHSLGTSHHSSAHLPVPPYHPLTPATKPQKKIKNAFKTNKTTKQTSENKNKINQKKKKNQPRNQQNKKTLVVSPSPLPLKHLHLSWWHWV